MEPKAPEKGGMQFVRDEIDPEIDEFSKWFSDPKRAGSGVGGFEREILRAFSWWQKKVKDVG